MEIFGHTGLTLGVAAVVSAAVSRRHTQEKGTRADSTLVPSWLAFLTEYVDVRLLLAGSLLPDIIDKPVGILLFGGVFSNGRIFSHTLLFLLLVAAAGFVVYQVRRQTWLIVLAAGTFTHLIFDAMWLTPRTLFWPFFGLAFDRYDMTGWLAGLLRVLLTRPDVYLPEMAGMVVLLWFLILVSRRGKLIHIVKKGRLS